MLWGPGTNTLLGPGTNMLWGPGTNMLWGPLSASKTKIETRFIDNGGNTIF